LNHTIAPISIDEALAPGRKKYAALSPAPNMVYCISEESILIYSSVEELHYDVYLKLWYVFAV
jgi:hypothetical protein